MNAQIKTDGGYLISRSAGALWTPHTSPLVRPTNVCVRAPGQKDSAPPRQYGANLDSLKDHQNPGE